MNSIMPARSRSTAIRWSIAAMPPEPPCPNRALGMVRPTGTFFHVIDGAAGMTRRASSPAPFDDDISRDVPRSRAVAPRRPPLSPRSRSIPALIDSAARTCEPRALGRILPAMAVRAGRSQAERPRCREGQLRAANARGAGQLSRRAARAICEAEARRPRKRAGPSRGVCRRGGGAGQRPRPPHHARNPALFGRRRDPDVVAGGARRGAGAGLDFDPRTRHRAARARCAREPGRWSPISASAGRWRNISIPNSTAIAGSGVPT